MHFTKKKTTQDYAVLHSAPNGEMKNEHKVFISENVKGENMVGKTVSV